MKVSSILIFIAMSTCQMAIAQIGIEWQLNFGGTSADFGIDILELDDGSFIAGGQIGSTDFDGDSADNNVDNLSNLFLMKIDPFGNQVWKKFFDHGIGQEFVVTILQSSDNGFIIGGSASASEDYYEHDCWIIKLDSEGNIEWENTFGGTSYDWINDIIETPSGNIIAVGGSRSDDGDVSEKIGEGGGWMFAISNEGELIWDYSYGAGYYDKLTGIAVTEGGEYIVTGILTDNDISVSESINALVILKISESGNLIWEKIIIGNSRDGHSKVITNEDGSIVLATSFETDSFDLDLFFPHKTDDFWIIKLNSDGEVLWERTYGTDEDDELKSIDTTVDGGYILGGKSGDITGPGIDNLPDVDILLIKIDDEGNTEWQQSFGGRHVDVLTNISQTSDGYYVLSAYVGSDDGDITSNHGYYDAWFVKLGRGTSTIKNTTHSDFQIFPNPSYDQIVIDIEDEIAQGKYSIFSLEGIQVKKGQIGIDDSFIFIGDLKKGMYQLQLEMEGGSMMRSFVKM